MSDPVSNWSGRLIVRILEKDVEPDYEQQRKPKAKVDPSPLISRKRQCGDDVVDIITNPPTIKEGNHNQSAASFFGVPDGNLRIDVSLFSKNDTLTFNMTRKGNEEATTCLKRLELSLAKKVLKKKKKKDNKKIKKHKTTDELQNMSSTSSTVMIVNHGDDDEQRNQILDVTEMSNLEFWCISLSASMKIDVTMDGTIVPLSVTCNPPTIIGVSTFENFGSKIFPNIPLVVKVDTLFTTHAIVDWYANDEQVCHNSNSYSPLMDDIGKYLTIIITPIRLDHNGHGCQEAYRFENTVESFLPENTTLKIRSEWLENRSDEKKMNELRVLSYNILADQNAFKGPNEESFFPWVPRELLVRSRRMPLVVHEILAHKADIICLQEVDKFIFSSLFQPVLESCNYQGFFSLKETGGNNEGCAMFWALGRFQKATKQDYRISNLLSQYVDDDSATEEEKDSEWSKCADVVSKLLDKRPDLKETVLTKLGHILQVAHLKDLNGNDVVVANTHLFFHPIGPHIRALQCFAIAHQLTKEQNNGLPQKLADGKKKKPFILCGDLNTSLQNAGALLIHKGIPMNHRNYRECLNTYFWNDKKNKKKDSGQQQQQEEENCSFDDNFPALSLPESFPNITIGYSDPPPQFTHYIKGFSATLDHILMTEKLEPLRQAPMPSLEQVKEFEAMPSPKFPSDHISLACDIKWEP